MIKLGAFYDIKFLKFHAPVAGYAVSLVFGFLKLGRKVRLPYQRP